MANSLRKNFSWSLVGNIVYALCQWMMLIIIARLGNARDVGIYSLALAISAPVMLFLGMNLRVAIATDQKHQFNIQDYLALRVCSSTAALLIISFVAFFLYRTETYVLIAIIMVSLMKLVESLSDVCYGFFQQNERNDLIAKSLILRGVSTVLLLVPAYDYLGSLTESLCVILSGWLAILVVFDARNLRNISATGTGRRIRFSQCAGLLRVVFPLGFVALFDSLTPNITRYAVEFFFGLEKLGYFSAIAYLMVAGGTVTGALGNAATPRMARHFVNNEWSEFCRVGLTSVLLGSGVGVCGLMVSVLYGEQLLGFVYGEPYIAYQPCLVIVMLASILWYAASMTGCMLNAARRFGHQLLANWLAILAVCIAVAGFGSAGGINGIAWALAIGMGARLAASLGLLFMTLRKGMG
ncbi:lipopolysaccharide biosynthesis protein [Candidatus Accumulibacter phosphatis]|uniref:Heteropolysaccharide repeat unit export protein n=1 Tax=Candidatus Accumulibacter phosphatis TaxID=327160 RepID=A0A5S4F4F6_9PROT|nr:oligosaccharide flippase family protein [Candidatus Accumulibacter phosphatis]TMQ75633.1 Heteropolysaccharide repeat unit export protein [Candidatus Accumulibacter phosphatis]